MFSFARNTFTVQFKNFLGMTEINDEYGNATGCFEPTYGQLQSALLSVSPNMGTSQVEMFGNLTDYDRTMATADTTCTIDENTILWLDGQSVDAPHNYIVKKRAPWKNSVLYAIKKVTVSE